MAIDLNSISKNTTLAPPRIVLHGSHGIGKTTFGARAPKPIILPTEDGLGSLEVDHFPLLRSYGEVLEALSALYSGDHGFQTVVLDSIDWLEPMVWAQTCARESWEDIEKPGYGKGYLAADQEWRGILEGFNALRMERKMCCIILAHSEVKRFDSPETEPYDRYQIKLQKRAAAKLEEWADVVLYAGLKTHIAKADAGFNKKVSRGISTGERVMYTEERPAFVAKNRYQLPPELPFSWEAFAGALTPAASAA